MPSVLQYWVMDLPLREQGTLLCAIRGCDLSPKFPLDSPERRLTAAIRGYCLNPADPRELDYAAGCFMSLSIPVDISISALGHYPSHWLMHAFHACEVLGFRHPRRDVREAWTDLYLKFCQAFHVEPEPYERFVTRLSEDRIANNTVVS